MIILTERITRTRLMKKCHILFRLYFKFTVYLLSGLSGLTHINILLQYVRENLICRLSQHSCERIEWILSDFGDSGKSYNPCI